MGTSEPAPVLTLEASHVVVIAGLYGLLTLAAAQLGRGRSVKVAWRVDGVERQMQEIPTRREVVAIVEGAVGGIRGEVHGLAGSVRRIEGMLNLLIEHNLDGDRP